MTVPSQPYSAAASAAPTEPFELSTSRVMMVDDDRTMLEVVQTYLEEAGYTNFITTTQSTQALALFGEHRPDVLLLDLTMPGIDGFDILAQIRSHGELRYTPVVVLTAETGPKAKLRALELGATDFLAKPVDPSELKLRLRNVLAFKAYQDRLIDFDALTGLLNRNTFRSRLSEALADSHNTCALLHLDLDRFNRSTTRSAIKSATDCCVWSRDCSNGVWSMPKPLLRLAFMTCDDGRCSRVFQTTALPFCFPICIVSARWMMRPASRVVR